MEGVDRKMTDFCPSLWPEEPTPRLERKCEDCGLINHGSRMIWGEGNPSAPIMVILDNPGAREDRDGKPFVCSTRHTLQIAVQSFFQDSDADVKSLRGTTTDVREYKVAVAYHPLAVKKRPNLWSLFVEDLQYVANLSCDH
ncbi:uracil-DNA glycosylase family protein [Gracilibacillus xinjiangensis]|uniref:Uracil-DNA glycosylase family protein n=1 Tax=Gracilibacillus xinjiangensis TaxID=1193282 RepID=A0ABV8WZC8_9BACI